MTDRRRGSRLGGPGGRRALLIALASTVAVFGGITWLVTTSPNWPEIQRRFFDPKIFADTLPVQLRAFWLNIQLFLVAEGLILVFGLVVAVARGLPGPVFFPLRLLATVFADLFRALPGILIIYLFGFGIPGLGIPGIPNDRFLWAVVALTLVYSAYVSEVYRAGIESVHPSQTAAARSLGLSHLQAMRHVVVPQAVRRVIPPLLNDFIGLQKDTALVSIIGVVEVFRATQLRGQALFNYTPYLGAALIFLLLTIPLARLTDWLVARESRQRAATGGVR
jgi:polar amino acid transport system permease protein